MKGFAGGAAAACAFALVACGGDDVTDALAPPLAHGARIDATVPLFGPDAATSDGDAPPEAAAPDASRARCVRESDGGDDAADDAAANEDAALDAPADASSEGGACPPRVLATMNFDLDPALTFGGATPRALAIGHAGKFLGPAADHRGEAGGCFLATHPGAVYLDGEDAWAEMGPFDVSAAAGCPISLHLWVWYELEDSLDAANLVASADAGAFQNIGLADGPSLYNVDAFTNDQCPSTVCVIDGESVWSSFARGATTWREAVFDLSSLAGTPELRLRLQFHSNDQFEYQGIYVEDLTVTSP